jgi:serine/threonine protein kinase
MGQVYLARSPGGWLVAVKVIRPDLAEEDGFRARFAREIAAARNVSGMYTAPVVDSDAEAKRPWMATAYVPGPSLSAAVKDGGPLPLASVLTLAAGLAEALGAIHRVGVVHRDLKPSNVLLGADGPRVIDFGISRAAERTALTESGAVMGSPGFMSPEQATGRGQVGTASDVFSLGAVLTFAATADGPFGGGTIPALLYRVVNEEPDLTRVPARLRPLIERCLAKSPAARPTPADLLTILGDDVGLLTGGWLPKAVADTLTRYVPAAETPPRPLTVLPADPVPVPTLTDQANQADQAHDLMPDTAASTADVAVAADTRTSSGPGAPSPLASPPPPQDPAAPGAGGGPSWSDPAATVADPARPRVAGGGPARRWRRPVTAAVAIAVVIVAAVAAIVAFAPGGAPQRTPGQAPSLTHVATRSAPTPPTATRPPTSSATAKATPRTHPSATPDHSAQATQTATSSCGSCSLFGGGPASSSPAATGGNGGDNGPGTGNPFGGGF